MYKKLQGFYLKQIKAVNLEQRSKQRPHSNPSCLLGCMVYGALFQRECLRFSFLPSFEFLADKGQKSLKH